MEMEEFNKKKNDLEIQKAEAEAIMDGAEVGRLEQELAQLEANKHTYEAVTAEVAQDATESQVKQITELGGSEEVLHEKVEAKQEEAKEFEQVLEEKGAAVIEKTSDEDIDHKVDNELELGSTNESEEISDALDSVLSQYEKGKLDFPIHIFSWAERAEKNNVPYDKERVKKSLDDAIKKGDLISDYSFENIKKRSNELNNEKSEVVDEKDKESKLSEKEKRELEFLEDEKKWQEKQREYLNGAIENTQKQRDRYQKGLDIPVTFINEEFMNGIARMEIPEAEEYRNARSLFNRENTPIDSRPDNFFSDGQNPDKVRLRKKGVSEEKLEEMRKKAEKYQQIKQKIWDKYGNDMGVIGGFSYSNDFDKKSDPYIKVGHGNHTFDSSLIGKTMKLGDLLDKEENIKKEELKEVENKIKEIEQEKERLLKK